MRADPDSWWEIMKYVQDKPAQLVIRLICKDSALYYPDWLGEAMQERYYEIYLADFPLHKYNEPLDENDPWIEVKTARYDALHTYSNEYSDAVAGFKWATCRELIEKAQLAVQEADDTMTAPNQPNQPDLVSPAATPTAY